MNNQKEFINQLNKEKSNYQYPSQAEDQANSLDTISDDIYSESERFIYELIQNADDACENQALGVEIYIEFTPNFVIISHTGKEFSEPDIKAVSSVGSSQKTKNYNQTGYKGIGFKSVFGKSDCVYINSNGFCFRFDKEYCQKQYEHKMPWQIIPIWTDNLDNELTSSKSFGCYPVSTAIKYRNTQKLKQDLFRLFSDTQIMLFLRNVTKIIVENHNVFVVEKIKNQVSNTVTLKKNGQIQSEWIVKDFTNIPIAEHIQAEIRKDDKMPKKLKESESTNISFAAKIVEGELTPIKDESIIFTYLPTKINWEFPFLVNADFLTNAAREGFHEDRVWNQWLFEIVAIGIFTWLSELAENKKYKFKITNLIPNKFHFFSSNLKRSFNQGFDSALENIAFIPNQEGDLLKVNEALIDKTEIHQIVDSQLLIQHHNEQHSTDLSEKSLANKLIRGKNKLTKIGVSTFEFNDLKEFLDSDLLQSNFKLEQNYELIQFLYQKATDEYTGSASQ